MKKSTLYVNGRIYTMDPDNTVYEAMAVEDGRIVRLGTTKELMEEMAPDQELEDLKGCPVLPGMCDCHVHMDMTGAIMVAIDAAGKGKEELLEEVRMRAQSLEKGKWIFISRFRMRNSLRSRKNRFVPFWMRYVRIIRSS